MRSSGGTPGTLEAHGGTSSERRREAETSREELRKTLRELVDEDMAPRAAETATDSAAGGPDPPARIFAAT